MGALLLFICLNLGITASSLAAEDVRRQEVEVETEMTGKSKTALSREALDLALHEALRQAYRTYLRDGVSPEELEAFEAKIFASSLDYVRNYQVLTEKARDGKWALRLSADIWMDALKRDVEQAGLLRVIVVETGRTVRITVAQPDRYRKLVELRQWLEADRKNVESVKTGLLSRQTVELEVLLRKDVSLDPWRQSLQAALEINRGRLEQTSEDHWRVEF